MSAGRGLPAQVQVLIVALSLGGIAALAWRVPDVPEWTGSDVLAFAALASAVALAERFWIPLRHQTETENFSVTDATFAAGLLLVRPSVLTLAVAAGALVGVLAHRLPLHKAAFNLGQFVVGIALAQIVFGLLGSPAPSGPRGWLAAAVAMAVFFAVNVGTVALVIALAERTSFLSVLMPTLALSVLHWLGNVTIGVLAAVVWDAEPIGVFLVILPLVLAYLSYRGWLESMQAHERLLAISRTADAFSRGGDLTRRIEEADGSDDVGRLGATFNRMLDRVDAAFQRERQFIREASHELATPITISRGHLEVLEADSAPEAVRAAIDVAIDELGRMGRIVEDLATLSMVEDPQFVLLEPLSLERFVTELAIKSAPIVDGRLQVGAVPEHASVQADPDRLMQAVLNLLQNAVLHTPGDRPIRLHLAEEVNAWRFEVSDKGGGIPAGEEETIFQPFARLDGSAPGTGLGLAIVRGIAEAHGGQAGVRNRPGEGATFWIRLPAE